MKRLLPSSEIGLAGVFRCMPKEIDVPVWQDHVVRHPLGAESLDRSANKAPWNREGWDRVDPPVITEESRVDVLRAIQTLETKDQRCRARPLWGKAKRDDKESCMGCTAPLLHRCWKAMNGPSDVGARYAAHTEKLLRSMSDAVVVPRAKLTNKLLGAITKPDLFRGLTVVYVGRDKRQGRIPIARLSAHDGVVVELYLEGAHGLRWRTTYRCPEADGLGPSRVSYFVDGPERDPQLPVLSDACLVARGWWETHGG